MGARRKARELALKALFEHEFNEQPIGMVVDRMVTEAQIDPDMSQFLLHLIDQFTNNRDQVDNEINEHSSHWKLGRMASVDRNVLRLGICEILFFDDVPKSVTINEYLEIAKKYGNEESSSFINGILDKVHKK